MASTYHNASCSSGEYSTPSSQTPEKLRCDSAPRRSRLVVLGLDGLPLSLARKLAESGEFPALQKLIPHTHELTAELPELSPVNWTSFFTGKGPEEHGVFGFSRIHSRDYTMHLADFTTVQTPTIFDTLSAADLCCRSINLPNTYPARAIKGTMMVSGFVSHDLKHAVAPSFLFGPLKAHTYQLEANTERGQADPEFLLRELRSTLRSRQKALDLLWPDLAWDLFVFVLTETDRLFHFFYDAVEDPTHPLHIDCIELLKEWDALILKVLELYEALPEPKRLMTLADHGFTRLITEVDLNAFLRSHHMLFTSSPPTECDELESTSITAETKAFALDPGRIYLHTAERFARGTLSNYEANLVKGQIKQTLEQLTYNGKSVFKKIHEKEDLYSGPLQPFAPDLICEPNAGFDCKAKFNRSDLFSQHGRTGTHTVQNVFFSDSQRATPKRVRDVGQEVLRHFGLADGQAGL